MKKFNKTLTIELSVDSFAANLLSKFDKQFPHAELLVEAIVASAVDKGTVAQIYSAAAGYDVGIDFKEQDVMYCNDLLYSKSDVGLCIVREINQYAERNVMVDFVHNNDITTRWVKHSTLTLPIPDELDGSILAILDPAKYDNALHEIESVNSGELDHGV